MAYNQLVTLADAGHMKHGLQAAVVESSAGYGHGTGPLVSSRISRGVPGHVAEQRAPGEHLVEAADEVGSPRRCFWREEFQRKKLLFVLDFRLHVKTKERLALTW